MEVSHLIIVFIGFSLGVFIDSIVWKIDEEPEVRIDKHPCTCLDAKNPTDIAKDKSIQNTCLHPEHAMRIRVIEACVTCETVEHYCGECGKVICSITDCV